MSQTIYEQIGSIATNAKSLLTVNQLSNKLEITNSSRNIYNHIRGTAKLL